MDRREDMAHGGADFAAPIDEALAVADRLTPVIRKMVLAEVEKMRPRAPRVKVMKPDVEIMKACRKVAEASDSLAQAKFSGANEIPARQALARVGESLARVMKKHGRMV